MTGPAEWPLGLARLAQALGRDLQRAARRAGGGRALWGADREALGRALGLAGAELAAADAARRRFDAAAELRRLAEAGILHVGAPDRRYPGRLTELHDPPFGLFARGSVERALAAIAGAPVVAIVGSRRATAQGRAFARGVAGRLAERGAVIVSGLAHGIDAAAHEGALAEGGTTVAVLGCGVDVPYPRRNRDLARRVAERGALVSEYWPGTAPAPWRFPARNRIVAGLAQAVAVVEAGRRSGALITADFALELGRPVLAVPGWPGAVASEGCNGLLRAGAALLEGPEDVVAEIAEAGWSDAAPAAAAAALGGLGGRIHELLQREPMGADRLADELAEDAAAVSGALALLEVEGLAVRGEGQRFWAAPLRAPPPGRPAAGFEG
ncbi:MAG TPA: DNA-processing protein DprA [Miltoncostaeaceae bacterium]|nr:DNA-processing protein DprA [Miltoncostaeaceae bacterium]